MKTRHLYRHRSGITLVEILVVTAIVLILTSLLYLALAPGAKRGAIETRIRSDLRQIVSAIAIYRADNDDGFPPELEALPEGTPILFPDYPERSEYCKDCQLGWARYRLSYSARKKKIAEVYDLPVAFDEQEYAIVDAPFYQRQTDAHYQLPAPSVGGGWHTTTRNLVLVLGAKTDGSIDWKPDPDEWQHVTMIYGFAPLPDD